jgi:hypothetical protein
MKPLAFNLKDAKKVAGDKDSSTFELKGGHQIRVVHNLLDNLQRKQIEKMPLYQAEPTAPVGQTDDDDDTSETAAPSVSDPRLLPGYGTSGSISDALSDAWNFLTKPGMGIGSPNSPTGEDIQKYGSVDAAQAAENIQKYGTPTPPKAPTATVAAANNLPDQGAPVGPPVTQAPIQAVAPVDTGYQQGLTGLAQQEDINKQLAANQLKIDTDHQAALGQLQADAETNQKNYENNYQAFLQDVQNGHINPDNYLQNMGASKKIATAIGLFLGGWSSGYTGQGNPALDFLNKQIQNDIEAQKENLINKPKTLLNANIAHYGDQRIGTQLTENMLRDITLQKAKVAADALGTPSAQANYNILASKFKAENFATQQQIQARQLLMQQVQNANATGQSSSLDPAKLVRLTNAPPDAQKEMLKEIGNAQAVTAMKPAMMKNYDQMVKDLHSYPPGVKLPSEQALGPMEDAAIHDNEGRVNEFEKNDLANLHPTRMDFLKPNAIATKRQAYSDFFDKKVSSAPTSEAYGLDLKAFKSTNPIQQQNSIHRVGDIVTDKATGNQYQILDKTGRMKQVNTTTQQPAALAPVTAQPVAGQT